MASYSDSPINANSFRPYVQQLPIAEMTSVGQYKQAKYDEGYQRIQSQIDKVAGLSILRPNDKEYLQSKMGQLGNNLRMVSMGDFSNYQLVNQVGGMVSQVGKDEKIQNAVMSTARVGQERQKMDTAQKAGKSSPNREYDFNRTLIDYMNDPNVGANFSGQYKEHVDVNKKVIDVIGKLHPNVNIRDIVYGYNKDGSIDTKSILNAMHRQGITEVSENQIRTAVNSVLDENDYDELASAGRYHYRGYQTQDLGKIVDQNYQITRQQYQKKLDETQKDLLSATNPAQILELNDTLKYYKNLLGDGTSKGKLDENYRSMIESVSTNPDSVRADLYTRNWLDQISNGFSYREVKDEVLASPLRADFWKEKEYNFSLIKEQNEQSYRSATLELRRRELDIAEQKAGGKKEKPTNPNSWGDTWVRYGDATTEDLQSLTDFKADQYAKVAESQSLLKEIASKYANEKVKLDEHGALILIEKYKNGKYTPENPSMRAAFDKYIKTTTAIASNEEYYNAREDAVSKRLLGGQSITERLNKDLAQLGDLTVNIPGEGEMAFSAKEVHDYLLKEQRYTTPGGGGAASSSSPTITVPLDKLSPRELRLHKALEKRYESRYFKAIGETGDPVIDNYVNKTSSIILQNKDTYNKVQQLLAKDLADVTGIYGLQGKPVEFAKDTDKQMFADQVSIIVNKDATSPARGYDAEKAMRLLKDNAKEAAFAVMTKGDSYSIRVVSQTDEKDYTDIPVPASFIAGNTYLGTDYLHENVNMAKQLLLGHGSTNPFGVRTDFKHAYYTGGDFGKQDGKGHRTVTLPVVADLEGGVGDGTLFPIIKLQDKSGNILPITGQQSQNVEEFEKGLKQLTDVDIIRMFKAAGYANIEQLIQ